MPSVSESVIRRMTRLAMERDALNLSQGFPNEAPPKPVVLAQVAATLGGSAQRVAALLDSAPPQNCATVRELLLQLCSDAAGDELNQYTQPAGFPPLRHAVREHYARHYDMRVTDDEITVGLGATEPFAATLRALCKPGDTVVLIEPMHELYPQQCLIWGLSYRAVGLRAQPADDTWALDVDALREAVKGARAVVLNTPHNPTGHVFSDSELSAVCDAVKLETGCWLITDEIYDFIRFPSTPSGKHQPPATLPGMRERTVTINAISKAASATGWRVGWAIAPSEATKDIRAAHDQLVVQAATPMQFAAVEFFKLPDEYFYEELPARFRERRDFLVPLLRRLGFVCVTPQSAYYVMADYSAIRPLQELDPMECAMKLLDDCGVAAVPGDNFFTSELGKKSTGARMLRFCFCRDLEYLQRAGKALEQGLAKLGWAPQA